MDTLTTSFYQTYATALASGGESSRSAMLPVIERHFTAGDFVLDVGAGSGRDVAAMLALGIEAFGVEPTAQMREHAAATHPALLERLRPASLPALGRPFADIRPHGFDGVVCSAVLMHITPAELPEALSALAAQLRCPSQPAMTPAQQRPPVLLISIPEMNAALLHQDRDPDGRRFHNHAPAVIADVMPQHGLMLQSHEISDAVLASAGTRWHTMAFSHAG